MTNTYRDMPVSLAEILVSSNMTVGFQYAMAGGTGVRVDFLRFPGEWRWRSGATRVLDSHPASHHRASAGHLPPVTVPASWRRIRRVAGTSELWLTQMN